MSSLIMGRKLLETWEKMHHNNNKIPQTQIIGPFHLKESKEMENNNTTCTHFHTQFHTLLRYKKDGPHILEWIESVYHS